MPFRKTFTDNNFLCIPEKKAVQDNIKVENNILSCMSRYYRVYIL